MSQAERRTKINKTHSLPLVKQCQLLSIARSSAYYQPKPVSEADLALMRRLDELHVNWHRNQASDWQFNQSTHFR